MCAFVAKANGFFFLFFLKEALHSSLEEIEYTCSVITPYFSLHVRAASVAGVRVN